MVKDSEMIVHVGPQHPAQPGPYMLDLTVEGETINDAVLRMGYEHKGMEKIFENRTYISCIPLTDRICYLASLSNNEVFCNCVEDLLDVEIPERAQYIRVMLMELSRIQSHLISIAEFGSALGFMGVLMYSVEARESILTLLEDITGARVNHSFIRPGGVRMDLPEGFKEKVEKTFPEFEKKVRKYQVLLEDDEIYLERTKNVGVLSKSLAKRVGVAGPVLRASGVKYDIRRVEPTLVYPDLDFKVITDNDGDVFSRVHCRFEEIYESIHIIQQCLDSMPSGEWQTKLPKTLKPEGITYRRVEDPRGEMAMYMIADGSPKPYRVKVRGPAYPTLQALPPVLIGGYVADVAAIAGSMDGCTSEVER
ncbi:MAG: NADH-quinone oxidoreductase subunit D-related protein [Methermicoccaceae archaeon]